MAEDATGVQPWLSLTEAARATGLDREAIRSRARRGLMASRKNNRNELLVQLPTELLTGGRAELDRGMTDELTGLRAAMTDLAAEVSELRVALARAQAERDAARTVAVAEVATARADVKARDALIAELKLMLAEARKPWWRRWMA